MAESLKVAVLSQSRAEVEQIELSPIVFGEPLRRALLSEVVRMQTANRRAGTASTKEKGEVRGGGKKPWRQKGTGRARAGSIRSPLWPGGGTIFGPRPRDYSYLLPKQARRSALRSVLTQRHREGRLTILDKLELAELKTKHAAEMLRALEIDGSVLIVIAESDERTERAVRNLPRAKVIRAAGVNVYDVLHHHHLLMTKAALEILTERLAA